MKRLLLVPALAVVLTGCFFVSKKKPSSTSQSSTAAEPKNHGQARSQEVHERNEERKEQKDADKK